MGLRSLGAFIEEANDVIHLKAKALMGTNIDFYLPTTSGTENIMIAGVLARGKTTLRNANTRPEVIQLADLLNVMGGNVKIQSRIVEINGVKSLKGGIDFSVMSGWDEALTYMMASAATKGEVAIKNFNTSHIREDCRYLREAGVDVFEWKDNVYVSGKNELKRFDLFTAPYPGVNSDMQPLFTTLALKIQGTSTITDLRFTDRFQYVEELKQFGSDIEAFGNTVIVSGGLPLKGTNVVAHDIRGGMACVIASLLAEGESSISNIYQIERGYEDFVGKFSMLGARIRKVTFKDVS